jgi:hypothetical protein
VTRHPALLASYALLAAAFALGTPAEAGDGVRLNFGGPLGTFVATPTPGYGGGGGYATQRKPQLKVLAAKRHRIEEEARHGKTNNSSHVTPVRYESGPVAKKTVPITAEDTAAPGLLSRTLASDQLPRAETVRILPPTETIVARDVNGPDATKISAAPKAAPATKVIANAGLEKCRKFIPAVGATVTVSCN